MQMTDASGRVVYQPIWPNSTGGAATVRPPLGVLGLPVQVSQLAAASATKGDIQLIDPQQYAFGMRQELEIGVSEHVNFLSNQITYRFLFRGDGQSRINTYLTLQNGDQVSNFVYLAT
jgi:HK97 family phage major capsid protein